MHVYVTWLYDIDYGDKSLFFTYRRADRQPANQNVKEWKKEGDPVDFAWNNSKYMDFPDPEKKTGRVTKVFFSDNRAYVLRCSQIYCFDMNCVQVYLLFVIDL